MENKHREKISGIAFQIFRAWTKNAAIYYPDMDFTIIDETKLVNDLETSIIEGIRALQKKGTKADRWIKGFDYSFLIGFIEGFLGSQWTQEYISTNSDLYRDSMACKAILEYLKFDKVADARINNLYKMTMKESSNLANVRTDIDKIEFKKYRSSKTNKAIPHLENDPVYTYLENQLYKEVRAVIQDWNKREILPELTSFFEPEFINELILTYEK